MELGGLHHVTAVTGNAPAEPRLLHQHARSAAGQEDGQPGRRLGLSPLLRRRSRQPRHRGDLLRLGRHGTESPRHGRASSRSACACRIAPRSIGGPGVSTSGASRTAASRRSPGTRRCASPIRRGSAWPWWPAATTSDSSPGDGARSRWSTRSAGSTTSPWPSIGSLRRRGCSPRSSTSGRPATTPRSDNPALRTVVFESGPGGPGTEVRVEERPDLPTLATRQRRGPSRRVPRPE